MQRPQTAPVDEAGDEEHAERQPDPPRVQRLPSERPSAPAGHLPRDLRSRPRLQHAAVSVLDRAGRYFSRSARPHVHGPMPCRSIERRVRARVGWVAIKPAGNLADCEYPPDRLLLREPRSFRRRGKGDFDEAAALVVERRGWNGGAVRPRRQRERCQCDGGAACQRRPNDQSLLPTKLRGVTSTIATAWAKIGPSVAWTSSASRRRFAPSAAVETTRKRRPW